MKINQPVFCGTISETKETMLMLFAAALVPQILDN